MAIALAVARVVALAITLAVTLAIAQVVALVIHMIEDIVCIEDEVMVCFAELVTLALLAALIETNTNTIAVVLTMAVIVALAIDVGLANSLAVTLALGIALAAIISLAIALALTLTKAVAVAVAVALTLTLAVDLAVALAVALAMSLVWLVGLAVTVRLVVGLIDRLPTKAAPSSPSSPDGSVGLLAIRVHLAIDIPLPFSIIDVFTLGSVAAIPIGGWLNGRQRLGHIVGSVGREAGSLVAVSADQHPQGLIVFVGNAATGTAITARTSSSSTGTGARTRIP